MHVEAVVAEVAAGSEMERRLPGLRSDVREVGWDPVVPGCAIDELVGLAQLHVVVVVRRQDVPTRDGLDEHVERLSGAVVAAVQPRQDILVGLAGLEHVGQEVGRGFVPVAGRPVDRDTSRGDLANIGRRRQDGRRAQPPDQPDDPEHDRQRAPLMQDRSPVRRASVRYRRPTCEASKLTASRRLGSLAELSLVHRCLAMPSTTMVDRA